MKGQLEICIEEGKGLRPSVEPYVVCIFQLNEDISAGPKVEELDTTSDYVRQQEVNLAKGVATKTVDNGSVADGSPLDGLRSWSTSFTTIADMPRRTKQVSQETTNPVWKHSTTFDVVGENNDVNISIYDRSNNEAFIGHVRLLLNMEDYEHQHEDWYKLHSREGESDYVTGEIKLNIAFHATGKRSFGPDDFQILKPIGRGTFRLAFQVQKKDTGCCWKSHCCSLAGCLTKLAYSLSFMVRSI